MINFVKQCPLFKDIDKDEIQRLLDSINHFFRTFNKNYIIANRGDECKDLTIVINGKLRTEMHDPNGNIINIHTLEVGEIAASAFLFGERNRMPVTLIADSDCKILVIPKESLLELMQKNRKVLNNYLNDICSRTQFLTQRIWSNFSNRTIKQKVAAYLLNLKVYDDNRIFLSMSIEKLAEHFDVKRPSLSRIFSEFYKDGLLKKISRKELEVIDRESLKNIIE